LVGWGPHANRTRHERTTHTHSLTLSGHLSNRRDNTWRAGVGVCSMLPIHSAAFCDESLPTPSRTADDRSASLFVRASEPTGGRAILVGRAGLTRCGVGHNKFGAARERPDSPQTPPGRVSGGRAPSPASAPRSSPLCAPMLSSSCELAQAQLVQSCRVRRASQFSC
jgi:hypothetical protein